MAGAGEHIIELCYVRTPSFWGDVCVAWAEGRGVAGLAWAANERLFLRDLQERYRGFGLAAAQPVLRDAIPAWLGGLEASLRTGEAFAGPYDDFDVSPFHRRVLEACRRIPKGEVRTYGWLARQAGNARAARAAGSAMAGNSVALLTPCHRVLPSTLKVGKYGLGGAATKRRLLALEGVPLRGDRALVEVESFYT